MTSDTVTTDPYADARVRELLAGRLADPFAFLGPHDEDGVRIVRSFQPGAVAVDVLARQGHSLLGQLTPIGEDGLFAGPLSSDGPYLLRIHWPEAVQETEDPYSFGLLLGELDLHLFAQGAHWQLAERMGAARIEIDGVEGVRFAVWAPNARRVSVVGDFNSWDGRRHPMRLRHQAGVWELFVPRLTAGARYKYELIGADGQLLPHRADPLARASERPPATASVVPQRFSMRWTDSDWMAERAGRQSVHAPITIYEVHAPSWLRPEHDPAGVLDWKALAERLVPYVSDLGFTHLELLPIMEHPFGGSWGYQPLSLFAPSARFGQPHEFAHFVDAAHRAGLGVILDWVPGHFPTDPHGLAQFDGTALYEHADPREGFHRDWNTLIYNFGRREVQGFLIASALYWLETFHVDGLRVDAVASMLYRDYSREPGEWVPNQFGGRENLEAIELLRRLNTTIAERAPGAITIAEESTAWPGVSAPVQDGGLGFQFKWNMGWMHDSLIYMSKEPIYRRWHHNEMTFSLLYAYSERYILPLSHDEVVHGKGSLYGRMPGDVWQKRANLRAYYAFMWTHPGKKLLFMGGELGQPSEWSHDGEVEWHLLDDPAAAGLQRLIGDLNRLYARLPQLHASDFDPCGFSWVVGDDYANSVFAYVRRCADLAPVLVLVNLTPQTHKEYRVGVPLPGYWRELINTDAACYGGSNVGNDGGVQTRPVACHGYSQSLTVTLPPLAATIFQLEREPDAPLS
ncbi:MAG: 1,4-alpha-glucan branching protein GlgB [Alphaproteobacteria bacterium]|nr:1,4-alpha-glucan branching protein GlgB [Alphaproteobacteria bacterium]